MTTPTAGLSNPILVVHDYDSSDLPTLSLNAEALQPDKDYYITLDTTNQQVWITLAGDYTGANEIEIKP